MPITSALEKKSSRTNLLESKRLLLSWRLLLSTPMGIDYVVIGFDMDVQPLATHNAA